MNLVKDIEIWSLFCPAQMYVDIFDCDTYLLKIT